MNELVFTLTKITQAQSIEDLWDFFCGVVAQYGIDRVVYGFTRYHTGNSFGDPQDLLILSNLPQDYMEVFVDEGLFPHAPMVEWATNNEGACSWSLMRDMAQQDDVSTHRSKAIKLNQKHGITTGYTVSFKPQSMRARGAVGLIAQPGVSQDEMDDMWSRHGGEIELMATVAHLKLITLPQTAGRQLTARQREVLEWVGDGKTTQDIAQIMGLTAATIEKHMRLARESMDVDTTAQAVLKAALQNQMYVLDRSG